jgi:hypothetical protein
MPSLFLTWVIKKNVYWDVWRYHLSQFKKEFIGIKSVSKDCKILNPKAIHFNFNAKNNKLEAIARKPLKIRHQSLGSEIMYELEAFTIHTNRVIYADYSRYKTLKYSKIKQRKWEEKGCINRNIFGKTRAPLPQTSSITPLKWPSILDKKRNFNKPF